MVQDMFGNKQRIKTNRGKAIFMYVLDLALYVYETKNNISIEDKTYVPFKRFECENSLLGG